MVTASKFKDALSQNPQKTGPGETATKYAFEVAAGRLGDEEEPFETYAMRRGSMLEPEALEEYCDWMMRPIEEQSIIFHDTLPICGTPDGFVEDRTGKGIVECKCRTAAQHAAYLVNRRPNNAELWQIQGNLWLSGRDFCDFVSYRPRVPEHLRLVVLRVFRDEKVITDIALRIGAFVDVVQSHAKALGVEDWVPYHIRTAA